MLHEQHSRTAMLLGDEAVRRLADARVAVFGIGGVGGYVAEALARAGIGALDLIDSNSFPEGAAILRNILYLGMPKVAQDILQKQEKTYEQ